MTPEELRREAAALNRLPETESRSASTRALLRRAEEAGHTDLALGLRLDLLHVEHQLCGRTAPEARGPRIGRMRVDFTRVLALHDQHPEYFGEQQEREMWSLVGFLVGDLRNRAAAPVADLTALLDDLERRFSPTGLNRSSLLREREGIARAVGDFARADALLNEVELLEWDPVWTVQDFVVARVSALTVQERYEEAVEAARPLLEGEVRSVDPDGSPTDVRPLLFDLLEPYLATGRLERAREAYHRTSGLLRVRDWRAQRWSWDSVEGQDLFYLVARLSFYALSGNGDRALELLRSTTPGIGAVDTGAQLTMAVYVAQACHRLVEAGRGDETVEVADGGTRRPMSVADLYRDRAEQTMRFARRADACHGNDHASRTHHDTIHMEPFVDHLDLGPEPGEGRRN
ncbi:hypothetical protein [Nocardiopsis sp. NRRL B-16309]|uniref:hypothetical protein n=1 Tax=Nocardiopsis sp. NRRL B-16309 TaxID=1519494 RepID=UPI0006ADDBED|nr:hypothetical protein [Nocardiopsis sp. NRRL B-16309]KOX17364.1 hypothetical protein ADL05_09805 [Nocardiopsis sp. NRRL B-16309]